MMKLKLLAGGEEPLLNCPQCIALKQMQIAKLDQKKIKPKEGGSLGGKFPFSKPERKIAHDYPFTIFFCKLHFTQQQSSGNIYTMRMNFGQDEI